MTPCPHCGQPMPAATLSQRLAAWRASNGLRLEDVAAAVGLSTITLREIERDPDYCTIAAKRLRETQPMMDFDAAPSAYTEALL